jgi:hypothetical protein
MRASYPYIFGPPILTLNIFPLFAASATPSRAHASVKSSCSLRACCDDNSTLSKTAPGAPSMVRPRAYSAVGLLVMTRRCLRAVGHCVAITHSTGFVQDLAELGVLEGVERHAGTYRPLRDGQVQNLAARLGEGSLRPRRRGPLIVRARRKGLGAKKRYAP